MHPEFPLNRLALFRSRLNKTLSVILHFLPFLIFSFLPFYLLSPLYLILEETEHFLFPLAVCAIELSIVY